MKILADLNPVQQEAVMFYPNKPLLILAGAGSGKTKVLTHRAAFLMSQTGLEKGDILLLTFTNKAAEEMMRRVNLLIGGLSGNKSITGGTFHSFCAKVLRKYAQSANLDPNFVIFDTADQLDVVKQAMGILGIDTKTTRPNSVLGAISDAKNNLIGYSEYAGFARGTFSQTVARTYMGYQQLLKKYKALDFDDLLLETVRLFKNNPEVSMAMINTFGYVMVDEYQDTNKAQYEITKELTKNNRRLTVVGDASQAIYSWRGADYRNLLLLKQDFSDLVTINLEQNYRSTQIILNAANRVIEKNRNHPILKLWTQRNEGEKITVYETESELDEASYLVNQIENSRKKFSDFAILYRTNAQSRVIEEAMLSAGIPYVLVGGVRFYERKEIKDVLAYLRLILNPDDEVSRKRAEKNGKGRLAKLIANSSLFIAKNTLEVLDQVLKLTQYLDQFDPENSDDAERLENIKELRSVAMNYPDLVQFLEQITLTEKETKSKNWLKNNEETGCVTLMTMHGAKGLEFNTVFMVGMEEGLFPHSRTLLNPDELEEERRLAYVGMTRAMDKLYLTYARRRLFFGTRSNNMVSRFLADIPEELFDTGIKKINKIHIGKKVDEDFGFDSNGIWRWKPDD